MSMDEGDDLEFAEDVIRHQQKLWDGLHNRAAYGGPIKADEIYEFARTQGLALRTYCRPTCEATCRDGVIEEDCGCPCHG